ncbi:MAG: glycoside hydrolase family 5 protein [Verrucomicrobia bacterium]|nr:glycoside hydrolase family 5 protein [Verrucomicrobiota bacterium]
MKQLAFIGLLALAAAHIARGAAPVGSPVFIHGQLAVQGTHLVNQKGEPIQLKGMSSFGLSNLAQFSNRHSIKWLQRDWGITLFRAAVGVDGPRGYLANPRRMEDIVEEIVEACTTLGLYVIIDWHTFTSESKEEAKVFFDRMSKEYGHLPNIIYELWNEPMEVSWDDEIRPYMEELTAVIRKNDPDNIILAGTPRWSSLVNLAADNPLDDPNTMYVLHFYSGSHKQQIRDGADEALEKGLPIFVSEFGVSHYDGGGREDRAAYLEEADRWIQWMYQHQISWANWSLCDKDEASAALKKGADVRGQWDENDLSESGRYIRTQIKRSNPLLIK